LSTALLFPSAQSDAGQRVVVSAVNVVEGGPLRILHDLVHAMADGHPDVRIDVLVHRRGLIGRGRFVEHEFPHVKRSWLRRLLFEWVDSMRLSRELRPDVWISAQDLTSRVEARRQFVYCHNGISFSRLPWHVVRKDPKLLIYGTLLGWSYRLGIRRNDAVIVQQAWLRDEFVRRYRPREVIVAHPDIAPDAVAVPPPGRLPRRFFYPTLARVFKNVELLCDAAVHLANDPAWRGELVITLDGSESAYAAELVQRYRDVRGLCFIGLQRRDQMAQRYREADALVFPSLVETWGLPLTEAKAHGLPLVVADLPYAHETVGACDRVRFFDPHDAAALARLLKGLGDGSEVFLSHTLAVPAPPYFAGWQDLLAHLLAGARKADGTGAVDEAGEEEGAEKPAAGAASPFDMLQKVRSNDSGSRPATRSSAHA
jgi:glycosyltransferase involved in cell wall biosynthesis